MIEQSIRNIADVDIFEEGRNESLFVGRPFYLGYDKAILLVSDAWKHKVKGIPQGAMLLAFYDGEDDVSEALLLRALSPSKLPTDNDVVSSMIEYYKEGTNISGRAGSNGISKLDDFTRYEFSFSGLECRVLGSFYKYRNSVDGQGETITEFGADIENFYSPNNYSVYKATGSVLRKIVNQRDGDSIAGNENEFRIGYVRFSSSRRFQMQEEIVDVYISPQDFIGKRTALFGMTRTGKSNTVKKIIEATTEISKKAPNRQLPNISKKPIPQMPLLNTVSTSKPFTNNGAPTYPVGQIVFDVNGEYANPNMQDEGTAIYELYKDQVIRYSIIDKTDDGFKVLKVNFFNEIQAGFELISNGLANQQPTYVKSFRAIDLAEPENYGISQNDKTSDEKHAAIAYDRKVALYKCCLKAAGFSVPANASMVKFYGDAKTINSILPDLKPHEGLSLDAATRWFTEVYDAMESDEHKPLFDAYSKVKDKPFFDEDMLALLVFLTRKPGPNKQASYSGFRLLKEFVGLHTSVSNSSFEKEIVDALRLGKIVIIDLSEGNEQIRNLYSDKITRAIFQNSMERFTKATENNFIQFYFEEAHNLFPKKEEKDLSDIYNRLAKEGAKLSLGMVYATQEVSSISSNILKNTQNWFIAHLNNEDELKELRKYYDFSDFSQSLLRFSAGSDKGYVRMKTYTNPFVVPVQIERFLANRK